MKICFVAPANNYHTQKFCNWFYNRGHEIHVISFIEGNIGNATVHYINAGVSPTEGDRKKLKYLLCANKIKQTIKSIKPDIVNVHYASSYGLAVALSGFHPYILSVWGSDVYDFPERSCLHKIAIQYSLKQADYLFSTSNAMADHCKKYTNKNFVITPFGVDLNTFTPQNRTKKNNYFTVGTVKRLEKKYGIDMIIKALSIIKEKRPEILIKARIAGKGSEETSLKELAKSLMVNDSVDWLGFISQQEAAKEWANMDIGIITSESESESFGVSAIEAEASGIPIIVSDIPGLKESTLPGESSIVVPKGDFRAVAESIMLLYSNKEMRERLGTNGREYVSKNFEINNCFQLIERFFIKKQIN